MNLLRNLPRARPLAAVFQPEARLRRRRLFVCLIIAAFVLAFAAFLPIAANAEEEEGNGDTLLGNAEETLDALDLSALEAYLDTLSEQQRALFGEDVRDKILSVLNGDFALDYSDVFSAIAGLLFDDLAVLLPTFCLICSIVILCGILDRFKSSFAERGTEKIIHFVCYSAVLVLILSSLAGVIADTADAVSSMQVQMQAVFPVLLTLIATSGGSVSVAVYQPAVLFLSEVIVRIVTAVVFPLAGLMCVLRMAGHMSGEIRLKNFCALFASVIKWLLGITLTAFSVFLTVQGITSATYDGFSFKAIKYTVSNTVPIVGGFVGGGLDLVVAGSVLIKNSVGICSVLLMAVVLAVPLVQLAAYQLFLKLAAAVAEPAGSAGTAEFLSSLSGTVNYYTAGLICCAFMYFITVLLLICSSNAMF